MPNTIQDTSSSLYAYYLNATGYADTPSGIPTTPPVSFLQGYPMIPCVHYRQSTDRNSLNVTGKKLQTVCRPPNLEWWNKKPTCTPEEFKDEKFRKDFLKRTADWRRTKPLRNNKVPKSIPPGWVVKNLPSGKKVLRHVGTSPGTTLPKYVWIPEMVDRLRPSNRAWTRHNPKKAINALVNDLDFYTQQAYTIGQMNGAFSVTNATLTSYGATNPLVAASINGGGNFNYLPWLSMGYTTDPGIGMGVETEISQAALTAYWAKEIDQLSAIALKRHYARLKNQKVDLFTELSQGMQAVNMIANIAKRIAKSVLHIKKGNLVAACAILFPTSKKEVANDYLAWKYGIKPLVSDLKGAAEHLAEYISRMAPVKSNGHATGMWRKVETLPYSGNSHATVLRRVKIRVKYGSTFTVPFELSRQAAQLGFTNPTNVAWELVPFSFVVDWFLPIGDWLSSLSSLDGLVIKESYRTVYIHEWYERLDQLWQTDGATPSEYPSWDLMGISGRATHGFLQWNYLSSYTERENISCQRHVLTLPALPIPQFKNPISKGHVASAVALFTQLVSK